MGAYFAPYIDATGLNIPSYQQIYAYELAQFQTIYGSSVATGDDSSDVQWISVFSLMISDAMNAIQLAYNARSPLTAVGADLDAIVEINGISRLVASYSTAALTLTGVNGTVIVAGVAQDQNGYLWDLPANTTIPGSGTITVTATCTTLGAIVALAGTITTISTPTSGWNTVTNASAATVGGAVEADSALRARQVVSVALPSHTLLIGTISAVAAVDGVTRYATGTPSPTGTSTSVENPTGATDYFGNPAHSISMVVEGGEALAIATAIYTNKTIGCFTNGTTTVAVTDPVTGVAANISFFIPTYDDIYVTLVVHGLNGFTTTIASNIQTAVYEYLNELQIGETLTISGIYGVALALMPSLTVPQFSIQAIYASATAASIGAFAIGSDAGTGYVVGDVVTVSGGTGGTLTVTSVAAGAVTGLSFLTPGTGYSVASNLATTGGTGTGLTVSVTALGPNASTDITPAFNAVVQGVLDNVIVQVV